MITGMIAQLKSTQIHCERLFIIGLFYAILCLLLSIFSIKLSILLAVLGILIVLISIVSLYGDMIKVQIDRYKELQKVESEEEEEKWRTKMKDKLEKEDTPNE